MNENENLREQEPQELNLDDILKEFAPEEGEVPEQAVLQELEEELPKEESQPEEVQEVAARERAGEYLMMRLRTSAGIAREEYERRFLLPFGPLEEALERYRSFGHATHNEDGRWRLTPKGFLISNTIISDLLVIQDGCEQLQRFNF